MTIDKFLSVTINVCPVHVSVQDNTYAFNNNLFIYVIAFMNPLRCFLFDNDVNLCLLKHIK